MPPKLVNKPQDTIEPDAHLRIPFKGNAKVRHFGDELPRNRVEGFPGHIGAMTPKTWENTRNQALKEAVL